MDEVVDELLLKWGLRELTSIFHCKYTLLLSKFLVNFVVGLSSFEK